MEIAWRRSEALPDAPVKVLVTRLSQNIKVGWMQNKSVQYSNDGSPILENSQRPNVQGKEN